MSRSDGERFPWLRQARDESYEKMKDMTPEQMVEYYHREAQKVQGAGAADPREGTAA